MSEPSVTNKLARKVAVTGIMSALTIALGASGLGFITFPWAALTFLQVFAVIAALAEGPVSGMIVGLIFGLTSLIKAAVAPNAPGDVVFVNPLISVLPRVFIGPAAFLVYFPFRKGRLKLVGYTLGGIAGSLVNTVLVLGMFLVLGLAPFELALAAFITNGLPEMALTGIAAFILLGAWSGASSAGKKSRLSRGE